VNVGIYLAAVINHEVLLQALRQSRDRSTLPGNQRRKRRQITRYDGLPLLLRAGTRAGSAFRGRSIRTPIA
jgi:hypothetical protein